MNVCGAPRESEADDEVRKHLDHVLADHNSSSNEEKKSLVRITKVLKQVVAGMKYTVSLVAEGEESKRQYSCEAVFVTQPWIKPEPDIIKFTVSPID